MVAIGLTSVVVGLLLAGRVLVVGPDGPYRSVAEAVAAAQPGDTVEVHGGSYAGGLVVDRPISLVGVDSPVIDGGGRGTVVTLAAPGSAMRGFVVRASGSDLNRSDAGIAVRAPGVTVEQNQLEDVLFGISLDDAAGSVVRGNSIRGKDLPPAERGDGLRLWYSSNTLLEANQVTAARDCIIWYSSNVRMIGNVIEDGRYGLHFMYDDGAEIANNVLRRNSVGAYLMYSRNVIAHGNLLAANRGPSGFGLGLKDVDSLTFEGNWLVDNRVGAYIDNSPSSLEVENRLHTNVVAFNDVGLLLLPSVSRNSVSGNTFQDNRQQVSVQGGGTLRGNRWAEHGRGNNWSDYGGFDADGDGIGDVPYRVETLFGDVMDRQPSLRLLQFSLAANAVDFAARAFPALRPPARLTDESPLVVPPTLPLPAGLHHPDPRPITGVALGLLASVVASLGLARVPLSSHPATPPTASCTAALRISGLRKRFGTVMTVDGLDLDVAAGEVVALWGPNGAGKTTVLKCVVGLLPCHGQVTVAGHDALRHGSRARRAVGYLPQDVALHDDLTVHETVSLYRRLKRASGARASALLDELRLAEHGRKTVGALSGGLRQRLALALALLGDPPLLLLDEPTSNLDPAGRELLLALLGDLRRRGTAILLTSHRLEDVESVAARVLVLEHGRLALVCRPSELARRLDLRLALELSVAEQDHDRAIAVLQASGLAPIPNGRAIHLDVLANEKARPIGILERAGVSVTDFRLEERAEGRAGAAEVAP